MKANKSIAEKVRFLFVWRVFAICKSFQYFFFDSYRQLVESKIFEILLALSQDATLDANIKEAILESLRKAKDWQLIKKAPKSD